MTKEENNKVDLTSIAGLMNGLMNNPDAIVAALFPQMLAQLEGIHIKGILEFAGEATKTTSEVIYSIALEAKVVNGVFMLKIPLDEVQI